MSNEYEDAADQLMCFAGAEFMPMGKIVRALDRLPADVRDWARDYLVWFCPLACNGPATGFRLNPMTLSRHVDESAPCPEYGGPFYRVRVIYIAPDLFDGPDEKLQFVIAHEIAHHRLGHETGMELPEDDVDYEADADSLAREWGFARPAK